MLRKIRIALAAVSITLTTLLFLDITGALHAWFGWIAKIQFLPAILAGNFIIVAALVVVTLLFGRIYCSVICPLGIMQDIFNWFGRKKKKNRFNYSKGLPWLRYTVLGIFITALIAGLGSVAMLIAPYGAYGRIVSNLFAPLYRLGNNLFALIAEKVGSYAFYGVDVYIKSIGTFIIAAATFVVIGFLAWRNGRTWCNTICPVGTVLGFISRFSLFKPRIEVSKCVGCKLCARNCKASCINPAEHKIDYSRCVACFDCLDNCHTNAITYCLPHKKPTTAPVSMPNDSAAKSGSDLSRRSFLTVAGIVAATAIADAQVNKVDGGLAVLTRKKAPKRSTPLVPPGAVSLNNMTDRCVACQLCISSCPNEVLRPSSDIMTFMHPVMSFERGYCRPECTRCSEVCPAGAIRKIDVAEKSAIHIGHAVWLKENCIITADGSHCGSCARHCPAGAISMVRLVAGDNASPLVPSVDEERCIGCGKCENLCPANPFSGIYVEGHERHRID